ncbi:hypothetical protein BpHYR1_043993 [Brachionus plicatilis]|uniref:Uncharacterized protein n=1 Tax=Brachionus plicatilis TaxID=10195 RepID=A0A3M7QT40_BRAPC|nr:hypothetical protein BpHYR1_043993 [Brachionus plicatilis]
MAHLHTPPPSNDSSSPGSLSPGHWLADCCLLAHKDYFNVDAYHSKIIERCLLTQHEIKYLKHKLHQFKAEHKKLGHLFKSCKCELDKKHGHVTELATSNASLKSQLGLFKSLVHSCLLSPLSVYQSQSPTGAAQYQMGYAPPAHSYHQYSGQSPPQQQHYYLMDSASVYNQQIQLQLQQQQNQYPGQYYANSVYVQQQQQYAANGEIRTIKLKKIKFRLLDYSVIFDVKDFFSTFLTECHQKLTKIDKVYDFGRQVNDGFEFVYRLFNQNKTD